MMLLLGRECAVLKNLTSRSPKRVFFCRLAGMVPAFQDLLLSYSNQCCSANRISDQSQDLAVPSKVPKKEGSCLFSLIAGRANNKKNTNDVPRRANSASSERELPCTCECSKPALLENLDIIMSLFGWAILHGVFASQHYLRDWEKRPLRRFRLSCGPGIRLGK